VWSCSGNCGCICSGGLPARSQRDCGWPGAAWCEAGATCGQLLPGLGSRPAPPLTPIPEPCTAQSLAASAAPTGSGSRGALPSPLSATGPTAATGVQVRSKLAGEAPTDACGGGTPLPLPRREECEGVGSNAPPPPAAATSFATVSRAVGALAPMAAAAGAAPDGDGNLPSKRPPLPAASSSSSTNRASAFCGADRGAPPAPDCWWWYAGGGRLLPEEASMCGGSGRRRRTMCSGGGARCGGPELPCPAQRPA
jgi:hypothetical protein